MPSISIILPVYNGEKFIRDTINSILTQNFKDFELIVIDDGSKDNSAKIVKEFVKKDKRIQFFSQKNSGICKTRNVGIQKAKSKYIMFCDHDDIYLPGYLMTAFLDISKNNFDFVKYGCRELYINDDVMYKKNECILKNKQYRENISEILLEYENYNEYIWDGIYSKDILLKVGLFDVTFKSGCEDVDLMLRLIQAANSCKTSSKIFYEHYIRSSSSTSRKYSENTYESVVKVFKNRMKVLRGDKNILKKYKSKKTSQLLWAILGMFSFHNCELSVLQMQKRLKQLTQIDEFKVALDIYNEPIQKKIVIILYKMKMYRMLAMICKIKREIGV